MAHVKVVPKEFSDIIPRYDGNANTLNLFISKCEYVLQFSRIEGNPHQDLYLFHAVSSKLTDKAASLLSDNPSVTSWDRLKELLTQHFGDPRSEECIAIELETLKIKQGESYLDFCQRIQSVRSALFAKVNRLCDEGVKSAKMIIYNNTALNIFLYNLPEDLIRIVRLKGCCSLEDALSIVTEEVNFQFQYNARNKLAKPNTVSQQPAINLKPAFNFGSTPNNSNLRFAVPQNNNFKFGIPQNQGFRPNFAQSQVKGFTIPQGQFRAPQNFTQRPVPFQQPRAPFQNNGFKFGIPQQQGYRHMPQNHLQSSPPQFKFGIPPQQQQQPPRFQSTDVSMRTAPPLRQNINATDLYYMEGPGQEYTENYYEADFADQQYGAYAEMPEEYFMENNHEENQLETQENEQGNFQEAASNETVK